MKLYYKYGTEQKVLKEEGNKIKELLEELRSGDEDWVNASVRNCA